MSYHFDGHQWALAIDAAAPISGWRQDLMHRAGVSVPTTWAELLEVARKGLVAFPGIPIDSLMHFFMLCTSLGEPPFSRSREPISTAVGIRALEMLRELASLVSPECAHRNPISTWEHVAASGSVAFCPFAYGHSNYSRRGYAAHPLEMGGLITIEGGARCRSTLGGAGLAISSRCREGSAAVEYAQFTASPPCQEGIYFQSGGQPGLRSAWRNDTINEACNDFFRKTLSTLDEAWVRPRWNGYLDFQEAAGVIVHRHIWMGGEAIEAVSRLNELARQSMKANTSERLQ